MTKGKRAVPPLLGVVVGAVEKVRRAVLPRVLATPSLTLRVPPEPAARVRVVPARVRVPPLPLVNTMADLPAPRVMAPMDSVVAVEATSAPRTDRVPPLKVVA